MGGCVCKPETEAPWPDLPPEIVGSIFCRLPSHVDRPSFGAVCSQWRLAVRQQSPLPPAMPCINLGQGKYQSLVSGKVCRFPTPKGYRTGASFGSWLFYYHKGFARCFLRSPFVGSAIEVPTHYSKSWVDFPMTLQELPQSVLIDRFTDMKMVVCSSDLVVALFRHPYHGFFHHQVSCLASFRAAQLQQRLIVRSFVVQPNDHHHYQANAYTDIAFYQGKVFALSCWEELFCHELFTVSDGNMNDHLLPVVYHDMEARPPTLTNSYLVVSSDKQKLFMVRRRRRNVRAMDLWVFEADFAKARWLEVKDLGNQVLFIGRNCSMAFAAGSTEHWGRKFRGGNRVFLLGTEWVWSSWDPVNYKDIPSYCVYDMMSGETSLVWIQGGRYMERYISGWFFPQQVALKLILQETFNIV